MPKLSIYTDPKKLGVFISRFWNAITMIESREEAVAFLKDILTPTEIRMVAKRLQIADMLAKGYSYQDIKVFVRVTNQTISSVSNKLNYGENGLIRLLLKLEKIDQDRQNKLEGKTGFVSQPRGLSRAMLNLAAFGFNKIIIRNNKIKSIKEANDKLIDTLVNHTKLK